jgi:hypothetical protein
MIYQSNIEEMAGVYNGIVGSLLKLRYTANGVVVFDREIAKKPNRRVLSEAAERGYEVRKAHFS